MTLIKQKKILVNSNDRIFTIDNIKYWGNTDDWESIQMSSRVYVDMDGVIMTSFQHSQNLEK